MITHDMRLECDTLGCLSDAAYWCVWGCLESHVYDGVFCLACMCSKRDRAESSGTIYTSKTRCGECGMIIKEFFYTSITDGRRTLMGDRG